MLSVGKGGGGSHRYLIDVLPELLGMGFIRCPEDSLLYYTVAELGLV